MILPLMVALTVSPAADGQQMDARLYSNPPVGLNFVVVGAGYLWGGVALDPSVPIEGADAKVSTTSLVYARSLDILGNSGTAAVLLPYAWLSASGEVGGDERSARRSGLADLTMRFAANIHGAPALTVQQFMNYRQDTIVGVSVAITAPTGQYYSDKLINIGTNRWSFRPEIGVSKALGNWILEGAAGASFFTSNRQFLGSNVRRQDPVYGMQGHVIYNFSPALWGAVDGTYYWGGAVSVNGGEKILRQQNWRWGITLSQALGRQSSLKVYGGTGLAARAGTNFNAVGVAWEYRWGAGL